MEDIDLIEYTNGKWDAISAQSRDVYVCLFGDEKKTRKSN